MIIDAHCHVWPDDIARKVLATRPVGPGPGARRHPGRSAPDDGRGRHRHGDDPGGRRRRTNVVAHQRVHRPVDPVPVHPFGTVHPELSVDDNLAALRDNGVVGVKLHPLFQAVAFADPAVRAPGGAGRGRHPVIAHAGAGGDAARTSGARPRAFARDHRRRSRRLRSSLPLRRLPRTRRGGAVVGRTPRVIWRRPGRRGWPTLRPGAAASIIAGTAPTAWSSARTGR